MLVLDLESQVLVNITAELYVLYNNSSVVQTTLLESK